MQKNTMAIFRCVLLASLVSVVPLLSGCAQTADIADLTPMEIWQRQSVNRPHKTVSLSSKPIGVFDLCVDQDFIDAIGEGGDIAGARSTMGIDCESEDPELRYVERSPSGETHFVRNKAPHRTEDVVAVEIELGRLFSIPANYRSLSKIDSAVAIINESVLLGSDGVLRGMLMNTSEHALTDLRLGNGDNVFSLPFAALPGEMVPFEIQGISDSAADLTSIRANYLPLLPSQAGRNIEVTGSPGSEYGIKSDDGEPMFRSIIELVPHQYGKTDAAVPVQALVSFFDAKERVIKVLNPQTQVYINEGDSAHYANSTVLTAEAIHSVAFELPGNAQGGFGIWVGLTPVQNRLRR